MARLPGPPLGGVGPSAYVFLFGPDANRLILNERTEAFLWGPALRALLPVDGPTALVLSDGDDHRRRRRIVQPAFAHGRRVGGGRQPGVTTMARTEATPACTVPRARATPWLRSSTRPPT